MHLKWMIGTLGLMSVGCADEGAPDDPPIAATAHAQVGAVLDPSMVLAGETPEEALTELDVFIETTVTAEQGASTTVLGAQRRTLDPTVVPDPAWPGPPPKPGPMTTNASAALSAWLVGSGNPAATRNVVVTMPWLDDGQPGAHTLHLVAQLAGDPLTFPTAQQSWGAARMTRINAALAVWESYAEAKSIAEWQTVRFAAPVVVAQMTRAETQALFDADLAASLELGADLAEELDDAPNRRPATVGGVLNAYRFNGLEIRNLVQAGQFYSLGIQGDRHALVTESGAHRINVTHPGLQSANGAAPRVRNCSAGGLTACDDTPCITTNISAPNACNWHATAVTGILAGDMTQGQGATPGNAPPAQFSGVARDATAMGVNSYGTNALQLAADNAAVVANRSASVSAVDCAAYTGPEDNVDAFFDAGIGFFKSAGNKNNDNIPEANEADCNIGRPGRAGGAFTVGAYYVDPNQGPAADDLGTAEREDLMHQEGATANESSFGGTVAQGWDRTAVDILAPSMHLNRYLHETITTDGSPTMWAPSMGATSGATPVATGVGLLFRQWSDSVGGLAHLPGILYARMLLMGDGWDGLTGYLIGPGNTGFSPRSGAGRLRARTYNSAGLDGPFTTRAGFVCVDQGDIVTLDINQGNALSSDIDSLKVVAWHTRSDLNGGVYFNQVLMVVSEFDGFWRGIAADISGDNKKRIILDDADLTANPYRVELFGWDITGSDPNCPNGGQRVYYALLAEDADRESWENLCGVRNEIPGAPVPCAP